MSALTLPTQPAAYTDFNHLSELKAQAKAQTPEAKREVAQQFEALFLQMMIKSMRDATGTESSYLDGKNSELYWDMYHKQIAINMSANGGIGLADIIYKQLGGDEKVSPVEDEKKLNLNSLRPVQEIKYSSINDSVTQTTHKVPTWNSPDEFITDLYPAAKKAAIALNTEPEAILSIAALETGWGQFIIKNQNGLSSHNLFGIKANTSWQGEKVASATLEFEQGVMIRKKELFRAYSSPQESIQDFVNFIKNNPRYRAITEKANDALSFFKNLKMAGYATDPAYDKKLVTVLNSNVLNKALSPLKNYSL